MTDTLKTLRKSNKKRQKEWGNFSALFKAVELGGEVGEALNVVKKIKRLENSKDINSNVSGHNYLVNDLEDELADIIICVDLLASHFNIDLNEVIEMKFNKTSIKNNLKTRFGNEN